LESNRPTIRLFGGTHHLDRRALDLIEAANEATDDELMSTPRTAVWLGVSPEWLEIGRSKGWGPPFRRLSPRRIRYHRGDVKKWLQERAHRSTHEYETAGGRPRKGAGDAAE
jgi:hypothetical protein